MKNRKRVWYILGFSIFGIAFLLCVAWIVKYLEDLDRQALESAKIKENYVSAAGEELPDEGNEVDEPAGLSGQPDPVEQGGRSDPTDPNGQADIPGLSGQPDMAAPNGQEDPSASGEALEASRLADLSAYPVPDKEIDFDGLVSEVNADIYAWITIPGTNVDYPVLQHADDPAYYLEHNMDGSKGYPGCIYTEYYNSKDWDDPNTVLYGHNMRNGSMFATLHYYEDGEFFEEHPYVYLYSPDKVRVYQVFAAYEFGNVHLLLGYNPWDEESFGQYLEDIFKEDGMNNQFDKDLELSSADRIITLETCIGGKPQKRYLVQAVLVAEGEAVENGGS